MHIPTDIAVDNLVKAETRTLPPPLDLPIQTNAHDIVIGVTRHRQLRQPIVLSAHALAAPSAGVSFRLVAEDGGVALYLSCARELADHLVAQMHALHADIVLMPCDDPTIEPRSASARPSVWQSRTCSRSELRSPRAKTRSRA